MIRIWEEYLPQPYHADTGTVYIFSYFSHVLLTRLFYFSYVKRAELRYTV